MQWRNTRDRYGAAAKLWHWGMAVGVLGMLGLGWYMTSRTMDPLTVRLYGVHKATGVVILTLALLRLGWRYSNPRVAPLPTLPRWQRLAAHGVHLGLYGLMLAMPLTGWLMSSAYGFPVSVYGLFTMPDLVSEDKALAAFCKTLHELGMFAFFALLTLHIGAAGLHHFYVGDATLRRMLPGRRQARRDAGSGHD